MSSCLPANWCVKLALTCVCCDVVLLLWVHVCVCVTGVQPEELERHPSAAEAVEAYGLQDEQGAYRGPSAGELEWLGGGSSCRSSVVVVAKPWDPSSALAAAVSLFFFLWQAQQHVWCWCVATSCVWPVWETRGGEGLGDAVLGSTSNMCASLRLLACHGPEHYTQPRP